MPIKLGLYIENQALKNFNVGAQNRFLYTYQVAWVIILNNFLSSFTTKF